MLNVQAVTSGTTSSGVPMAGFDALTAVTGSATGSATAAADGDHTAKLTPSTLTDGTQDDSFAAVTERQTYAARVDADPQLVDADAPEWQSDNSILPAGYNPYLVQGKDVTPAGRSRWFQTRRQPRVRMKQARCAKAGIRSRHIGRPATIRVSASRTGCVIVCPGLCAAASAGAAWAVVGGSRAAKAASAAAVRVKRTGGGPRGRSPAGG
ncbi:hypothetical protein [Streptomyces collinus]|uniref:hypothetical protein n=1 Tax=Streptomyces collinus TaxID=42684 RepID=UPI00331EE687